MARQTQQGADIMKLSSRTFFHSLKAAAAAAIVLGVPTAGFAQDPSADQYKVEQVYSGKTKLPQFKGRDKAYREFRTVIRDGMKDGVNFAGEYSVVQYGCGAGCSIAVVADNRTGQVFDFPRGGESNTYMTLQYAKDSRLIIAQWASYDDSACHIDFFEWKGSKADLISTRKVGAIEDCYKDIKDNLKQAPLGTPV
jgi:hypothetical protein